MRTRYCQECGNAIDQDAVFCPRCGTKVARCVQPNALKEPIRANTNDRSKTSARNSMLNQKRNYMRLVLIALVILLVTIAVLVIVLLGFRSSTSSDALTINETTTIASARIEGYSVEQIKALIEYAIQTGDVDSLEKSYVPCMDTVLNKAIEYGIIDEDDLIDTIADPQSMRNWITEVSSKATDWEFEWSKEINSGRELGYEDYLHDSDSLKYVRVIQDAFDKNQLDIHVKCVCVEVLDISSKTLHNGYSYLSLDFVDTDAGWFWLPQLDW